MDVNNIEITINPAISAQKIWIFIPIVKIYVIIMRPKLLKTMPLWPCSQILQVVPWTTMVDHNKTSSSSSWEIWSLLTWVASWIWTTFIGLTIIQDFNFKRFLFVYHFWLAFIICLDTVQKCVNHGLTLLLLMIKDSLSWR